MPGRAREPVLRVNTYYSETSSIHIFSVLPAGWMLQGKRNLMEIDERNYL